MAKATNADILARLAKGECANFHNNSCQKRTPCTVIIGEPCDYFAQYVKPLLEYPEFSNKYGREAKITVALNPKAKVVRKRRAAETPKLAIAQEPAAPVKPPVKAPVASLAKSQAKPRTQAPAATRGTAKNEPAAAAPVPARVITAPASVPPMPQPLKHAPAVAAAATKPAPLAPPSIREAAPVAGQQLLFLELTPSMPDKRTRKR